MPTFATIDACINVDGTSLPEYEVQTNEAEKEVTCWIPSEAGKNFSVSWDATKLSADVEGSIFLDGRAVGGLFTRKQYTQRVEYARQYMTSTTFRDFSFAPIKYTDDDGYLSVPAQDFGNIQLTIWRVEPGEIHTRVQRPIDASNATLHERSKKLGAHCVHFGEVQNGTPTTFQQTKRVEFLARFVFRYRPIDMLRANGVAPPLPRPEPVKTAKEGSKRKNTPELDIKDDPDEDIEARVTRLKKELKDLEARRVKKRKVKDENREPRLVDNNFIDLT